MQSEIRLRTTSFKLYLSIGLCAVVLVIFISVWFAAEVSFILYSVGGVFLATGGVSVYARFSAIRHNREMARISLERERQQLRRETAEANKAELLAGVVLFSRNERALLLPGNDMRLIEALASNGATSDPLALPAPALDFYAAMSDPLQAYAIIGPQRVGKSIMLQHLTQHLTRQGRTCLVIGTKAKPGEWVNCRRYIGNADTQAALDSIIAEVGKRIPGNITTPPLCVVLDDWLNTVALNPDLAEAFFVDAATRMLTAGIVPYFLLQSDSKTDWGTRHGAQLKNNFTHLILKAPRIDGQLDHRALQGVMIYPGEKEQHPVRLPVGLPIFGDGEPVVDLPAPEPNGQERRILELIDAGWARRAITEEVWQQRGNFYNAKLEAIARRFGRETGNT
jgi:hypothetical protein